MGSSTQTATVLLPQFSDLDKPTWRGDINDAMSKIDAAITSDRGTISGHTASLAALTTSDNAKVPKDALVLNVKDHGITMDGATDDTAAWTALIASIPATGATLYVPPGTSSVTSLNFSGKSGVKIYGIRGKSVIQRRSGTLAIMQWNANAVPSSNDKSITIEGITFKGATGLSQFLHHLSISAVDDVFINNCEFIQFPGDGIYLGRTQLGGGDNTVQNNRIKITNCLFDGVDYTNRNGISIIAGNDVLIQGNTFTRIADPTMPGAIDIEPNSTDTSTILRDIKILDNTFNAIRGSNGAISYALAVAAPTTQPTRIKIANNTFTGNKKADVFIDWIGHSAVDTDPITKIDINNNMFGAADAASVDRAISLDGVRGVSIQDNSFNGGRVNGSMSVGNTFPCREIKICGNTFIDQGATAQNVIAMKNVAKVNIVDNLCVFTAATTGHFTYMLSGGTSDTIVVKNNQVRNISYVCTFDAAHTTTASTNVAAGNRGSTSGLGSPASFGAVGLSASGPSATTAPAAGGAGALPATPAGYLTVNINGIDKQIPYY